MSLLHLASRLYGVPLLITRTKLDVILAVLGPRIGLPSVQATPALPAPRVPQAPARAGIAQIPVHGTLVRRSLGLEAASGLTSYQDIALSLDEALADPQVHGILLDIDSPGGEAGGVFELAQRIRAASRIKPVWAHANDAAYSAAYALGCAASRLTVSATGGIGSIGVIALHVDQSLKDSQDGVAYTAIYAGQHKNDFSPHAPLSPQAAQSLQTEVDRLYVLFVEHVAQMRKLDPGLVRGTEAAVLCGDAAVAAGLADGVSSYSQLLDAFIQHLQPRPLSAVALRPLNTIPTTEIAMSDATTLPEPTLDVAATTPTGSVPELVAAARDEAHAEACAIAELCLMAGQPQRTAELLNAGVSQAQARHILLDARAEQAEIQSHLPIAGNNQQPNHDAVLAAARKLARQE